MGAGCFSTLKGRISTTVEFKLPPPCCRALFPRLDTKTGNSPGILRDEVVDAIPLILRNAIKRLVTGHVLPPTCVPDSCIINIYKEGDCISPHIDSHDCLRPFCTLSLLSECNIVFGSERNKSPKILGPGEIGTCSLPLPVGSVPVLNGNRADIVKHAIPAVPTERISISFRKMDPAKKFRQDL